MDFYLMNNGNMALPGSGGIVDILGEAENIVNGVQSQDIFSNNMKNVGAPIMEPLDSILEPTPLAPSAILTKISVLPSRSNTGDFAFSAAKLPKWMPMADLPYSNSCQGQQSRPQQQQQLQQQQPAPPKESVFGLSFGSLDDTPFNLEDADEFEAPPLVSSSSQSSSSSASSFSSLESPSSLQKTKKRRVRKYKDDQWNIRFEDLIKFRDEEGHVMVPHSYPKNQKLAQWVKRQRYQYRLKQLGKHSTLSDAREQMLNGAGFVWDSHKATWVDHFQSLEAFAMTNGGSCYIPPHLAKEKASLITWMKHQRRQYKRYMAGLDSTMNAERIQNLESVGFDWDPRNLSMKKSLF